MTTETAAKATVTTEEAELETGLKAQDVRFIYFGRKKGANTHKGVTCVGYHITESDTEENTITMSFSFCSPLDNFSRKKARMAILGRLNSDTSADVAIGKDVVPTYETVTNLIKDFVNSALPDADFADIKAVAVAANFDPEAHSSIGGVNLPWWFKGV